MEVGRVMPGLHPITYAFVLKRISLDFDYVSMLSPQSQKRKKALDRVRSRKTPSEFRAWIDGSEKKNHKARSALSERGWGIQNKAVKP